MGRSSVSCHHQLSANRMISRVHVKASYKPAPNPFDRERVEIVCLGWNGIKLHCQGKAYELSKGKTFTSDIKDADILIDVHDARALIQWPRKEGKDVVETSLDRTWDEETLTRSGKLRRTQQSSPFEGGRRPVSPISPSPIGQTVIPPSSPLFNPRNAVVVYEDESSPTRRPYTADPSASRLTEVSTQKMPNFLPSSQPSELSDLGNSDGFSDHDEENDPIILSFGPFGENLLPRMASFTASESPVPSTRSPRRSLPPQPLRPTQSPKQPANPTSKHDSLVAKVEDANGNTEKIRNHAINQLAFSRLSSTPFSIIVGNMPLSLYKEDDKKSQSTAQEIRCILDTTKCIGKVIREGKDAAGKPLESEYYYIPDFDEDSMRREAVVNGLRKPGLRNCRKQHKQYFWRKPK